MKIPSLIIDDEEGGRTVLQKLLERFCPDVEVVGTASSAMEGYALCLQQKPQLVFLDIQMPTGNGFKLLEKFKGNIPFDIIFVTGFDQYAINAIKFSALDYLLKPVDVEELKQAVERARKIITEKISTEVQMVNLLNNIDPAAKEKKITVHANDKVMVVNASDIAYIEADDRYCTLTTVAGEEYVITKTLKDFEEFFAECPLLVRISKSTMLNINHIKSYTKDEPCMIDMRDGKTFEVSRRKKQEVIEKIKAK
jgi:two-component system LytT family response regulator